MHGHSQITLSIRNKADKLGRTTGQEWWRGFKFSSKRVATRICNALNADVRMVSDNKCERDFCYNPAVTTKQACGMLYQQVSSTAYTEWNSGYNGGNGSCIYHISNPPSYGAFTKDTRTQRRNACTGLPNGVYVDGLTFTEGKYI